MEQEIVKVKKIGAISILGLIGGYPAIGSIIWLLQADVTEAKKNIAVQQNNIENMKEILIDLKLDLKDIKNDLKYIRDKVR